MSIYQNLLGIAGTLGLGVLAGTVLARGAYRRYPLFVSYVIFNFGTALAFMLLRNYAWVYFYSYWLLNTASLFLGIAVIHEAYENVFKDYLGIKDLGEMIFRWATGVLVMIAVFVVITSPIDDVGNRGMFSHNFVVGSLLLDQSVRVVQLGLVTLLLTIIAYLGMPWRLPAAAIAVGFAVYVGIYLAAIAARAKFGPGNSVLLAILAPLGFNCGLMIWLAAFLLPVADRDARQLPDAGRLRQWNTALTWYLHNK